MALYTDIATTSGGSGEVLEEDTIVQPESTETDSEGRIIEAAYQFKNYIVLKCLDQDIDLNTVEAQSGGQPIEGTFVREYDGVQYLLMPPPQYGSLTSIGLYFDNLDALSNEVSVEAEWAKFYYNAKIRSDENNRHYTLLVPYVPDTEIRSDESNEYNI